MSAHAITVYTLLCDEPGCEADLFDGAERVGYVRLRDLVLEMAGDAFWQAVDAETDTPVEWFDVAVEDVKADELVNLRFYCEDHRRPEHEDRS